MPHWTNQLPPEGLHMGFELRRTPASAALLAVVTSDDFLVCDTHFFHGRTTPCDRTVNDEGKTIDASPCPACHEQIPYRTHAYVSAFDCKRREHFIFECTAHAAKAFAEYKEATLTLRGCSFQASRPKGLKNSKVAIVTNTVNLAKVQLPEPPDLIRALCVIWRLPLPAVETKTARHRQPRVRTRPDILKDVREQPSNMPDPNVLTQRRTQILAELNAAATGNGNGKPLTTAKP